MTIKKQRLFGAAVTPHIDDLAGLRIGIFREYPYLYQGEIKHEREYLSIYAASPDSLTILAWDDRTLAGAVTSIPMRDETDKLADPVRKAGVSPDDVFYIGELLFLPPYRSCGLGSSMLAMAEDAIIEGGYTAVTCATVVRPDDHPARPTDFIPIERFLAKHGYEKMDGVTATFNWPELNGVAAPHVMQYWMKRLD